MASAPVEKIPPRPLRVGAVAYDPKVVTIWEGFRSYFEKRGVEFDYVLYSNYDSQVEANLGGEIDVEVRVGAACRAPRGPSG